MEPDEILRLSQISGLAEMFADRQFSEAWEAGDMDEDITELTEHKSDELLNLQADKVSEPD